MEVQDAAGSAAGQSQLVLTVSDEVQLQSMSLAFSEGESQEAMNETLPYPQALVSKSATLDPSQTLKVLPAAIGQYITSSLATVTRVQSNHFTHCKSQLQRSCV